MAVGQNLKGPVHLYITLFSRLLIFPQSRTKELYLSRAVDVQPCFNRDVISDLSDKATSGLLELQAWAEGEKISYTPAVELERRPHSNGQDEAEVDLQIAQAINNGNLPLVRDWVEKDTSRAEARERVSRLFLNTVNTASASAQQLLYESDLVDFNYTDRVNERNCVHEVAISGKNGIIQATLAKGANVRIPDVYGRIPLHYACMNGQLEAINTLVAAAPDTVDLKDLDNFTPLVHGIVHAQLSSVKAMLALGASVDRANSSEHIPLNLACQYGSTDIVQQMLEYTPHVQPDAEGLYPQHIVAKFGGADAVLVALRAFGVDMDQQDKLYQWTPLFHAASEGHLHSMQTLLTFDAQTSVKDEKGLPAMYYAAWEGHLDCMQLLALAHVQQTAAAADAMDVQTGARQPPLSTGSPIEAVLEDFDIIPDLSLPPPIIPLRRYGHSFLDTTKTFILLSFDELDCEAIEFYGDNKYPAARLTISSKSSDLIPRNVPIPVQDDFKNISFQIENLATFSIDFDIYPTFGSKVIARAAASSRVFMAKSSSSGKWPVSYTHLTLPTIRLV